MSSGSAGKLVVVVCVLLGLSIGGLGCLNDDTAVATTMPDSAADASGPAVDGSSILDAAFEAAVDASASDAAPEAGRDAAGPSQAGLVVGAAVGHSASYKMTVTSGPATAPVLRSPNYQLVGGMAVTAH